MVIPSFRSDGQNVAEAQSWHSSWLYCPTHSSPCSLRNHVHLPTPSLPIKQIRQSCEYTLFRQIISLLTYQTHAFPLLSLPAEIPASIFASLVLNRRDTGRLRLVNRQLAREIDDVHRSIVEVATTDKSLAGLKRLGDLPEKIRRATIIISRSSRTNGKEEIRSIQGESENPRSCPRCS